MARLRGTNLDDLLVGTANGDRISGLGGNDFLSGQQGNDTIDGGAGDDIIDGGSGDDRLVGGSGNDTILGGAGSDDISGGDGDDLLDGGEGDDSISGGAGNDTIIATSGSNLVAGGAGDDVYILHGSARTEVNVFDSDGIDTFDFSGGSTRAFIDLSGVSTVDGRTVRVAGGGTVVQPLDIMLLQDLTGTFTDDLAVVRGLVPDLVAAISAFQPDSRFGVASFVDKPVGSFGGSSDYVYKTDLPLTDDTVALQNTIDNLSIFWGGDLPEAQIEALMQLALRADSIGYRAEAFKLVVLTTDDVFHVAGDGAAIGLRPNNGDDVLDGDPPGSGEDYPTISQVRNALVASGIIPIFAVTSNVRTVYSQLVDDLGFGAVVELSSDSSNLVDALKDGIKTVTEGVIENAIGTNFADTILGNKAANWLVGNGGHDAIRGFAGTDTLEGGRGNDTLRGDAGNDWLNGGLGNDLLNGGGGTDRALFAAGPKVNVDLAAGTATGQGNDTLVSIENVTGSNKDDTIAGNGVGNALEGGKGNDILSGKGGNDTLTGGLGADELTGGPGADRFVYSDVRESNARNQDTITDFSRGQGDKIDVSRIDADILAFGNQKFTFVGGGGSGSGPASPAPGQLWVRAVDGGVLVEANVNINPAPELVIFVAGVNTLFETDFIL